ncbi:Ribosomal RNA small subunit methyltransferase E [uncultured delta proteobacterium]|uniref:Ribosomal RNA small subunit methyltransferase E n=1 Tax=uncultured delta proteobacterium TaxID=34034 RepID=A0A212J5F5_9DELT|nr:Ribosomal RNA small subunit methyltransferase E [uncultured delta proteobacterium]
MHTFFLPAEAWQEPYQVTGAEARHLVTVLRVKQGETVRLLDGEGREGTFAVADIGKRHVSLTPRNIMMHDRPIGRVTLAIGYGRGLRRGWLLEKAVELEAAGVWFWQADRSQGKVPEESKETWFSQMTAGAKQSNNPWLPALTTLPDGVDGLIKARSGFDKSFVLWEGDTKGAVLSMSDLAPAANALYVLGPEGGFSEREITRLTGAGFTPVSLGNRVLRWETAAMLCLGLAWWARQQETTP